MPDEPYDPGLYKVELSYLAEVRPLLAELGYYKARVIDSVVSFDAIGQTFDALRRFRRDQGILPGPSGSAQTLERLREAVEQKTRNEKKK